MKSFYSVEIKISGKKTNIFLFIFYGHGFYIYERNEQGIGNSTVRGATVYAIRAV